MKVKGDWIFVKIKYSVAEPSVVFKFNKYNMMMVKSLLRAISIQYTYTKYISTHNYNWT